MQSKKNAKRKWLNFSLKQSHVTAASWNENQRVGKMGGEKENRNFPQTKKISDEIEFSWKNTFQMRFCCEFGFVPPPLDTENGGRSIVRFAVKHVISTLSWVLKWTKRHRKWERNSLSGQRNNRHSVVQLSNSHVIECFDWIIVWQTQ